MRSRAEIEADVNQPHSLEFKQQEILLDIRDELIKLNSQQNKNQLELRDELPSSTTDCGIKPADTELPDYTKSVEEKE